MPGHEAESDRHQIHNTQTPSIHYFRFFCLTSPSLQKLQFGPGCTKQNLWWSMPCPTNNIKALKGTQRTDDKQGRSPIVPCPLTDWLTCGFTSHSTQNRSFGDIPQANLLAWYGKTKPTKTKAHIHQSKEMYYNHNRFTTTILRPFFRDHPGEPVPEENLWTLWCKGRLTQADILTIWLGATPSRLTSAHLHLPPFFYRPDALPAAQPTVSKYWRQLAHSD